MLCFSIKADALFQLLFGIGHIVLFQYIIWHTIPLVWRIAFVTYIFYTNLGGIKTGSCKITHQVKEGYSLVHFGFCFFRPGNLINHFHLLGMVAIFKCLII